MRYDNQEQPLYNVNANQILNRDINEFIGICRGIAFDNEINYKEASSLLEWINNHDLLIQQYPINEIAPKLNDFLKNDELSFSDALALLELLKKMLGSNRYENIANPSTTLAFDDDIKWDKTPIKFKNSFFVLTGEFISGERKKVRNIIIDKGGMVQEKVTTSTNYLVVGAKGSRFWRHSTHGSKIDEAIGFQSRGNNIKIIEEEHLMKYL